MPDYPLGTDFTETEKILVRALSHLKDTSGSKLGLLSLVWSGVAHAPHSHEGPAMERMGYAATPRLTEPLQARALRGALRDIA